MWRKEQASEIWEQSPERYKLWHWILLNVNYKTATVERTSTQMAKALRLPELPAKDQIRKSLKWLESRGMIAIETYGRGMERGYRITVENWQEYQSDDRTENAPRTHRERTEQDIDNTDTCSTDRTENAPRTHRERTSSQEERSKNKEVQPPPTPQQNGVAANGSNVIVSKDSDIKPWTCSEDYLSPAGTSFALTVGDAVKRLWEVKDKNTNHQITCAKHEIEHLLTRLHRWPESRMRLDDAEAAVGHWLRKGKAPRYPHQLWDMSRQGVEYFQLHLDLAASDLAHAAQYSADPFADLFGEDEEAAEDLQKG